MKPDSRVYIAGIRGMVGSAIGRTLQDRGFQRVMGHASRDLDLTDQAAVNRFFDSERPEYVFMAAARVGGIYANNTYPAEFIYSNLCIQNNVIHSAYTYGVTKLLFLGSSCIYPKLAPQPITEDSFLDGKLEPTNDAYAVAKIAGIKMCQSYNRQYGTRFIACMPTNLYGPNDNYDLMNAHVMPSLIRKIHQAKVDGRPTFSVWGTGRPLREFLYVDDLAGACVFLMENYEDDAIINVGSGQEVSIEDLARTVGAVIGFGGAIEFDPSKPDGTPRKRLDTRRLEALGWKATTPIKQGIANTYRDFQSGGVRM